MQIVSQPQSNTSTKNIQASLSNEKSYRATSYHQSVLTPPPPLQQNLSVRNSNNKAKQSINSSCLLQQNGYSIHLVNSLKQRIKTSTLIKRMYASRGYDTRKTSIFSQSSQEFTFLALVKDIAAGTLTLRLDSTEGLLADTLYRSEIDFFRKQGGRVCELSKLVLDPQHGLKEMIAVLFQFAYVYARRFYQATDFFCEVNPRHALPQKRMFGFQKIGNEKICPRVNAPAVLLHLKHEFIKKQIKISTGSTEKKIIKGSMYTYCVSEFFC